MQGIYTSIPETNYVPREYSVAAILLLLFMVLILLVTVLNLLYFYISTFRSMCALPNMAVFWSSLTSYFPGMLLTYFLNYFEIVSVAPLITGITLFLHSTCAVFLFIIIIIIIIIIIQQAVQRFHTFLRPLYNYIIFFLQLPLSFQSSSINPFSPISSLIPSAQVSLGLPRFLLPGCLRFITFW